MIISEILQSKVEVYSDVGKLLLLSWSRQDSNAELNKSEIAIRYGLSKLQASKAIRFLCAAGAVEPTRRHAGRGPVEVFRLEPRLARKISYANAANFVWINNIDDILLRRSGSFRSLRCGARLLMLYLWASSDRYGVVRDVTQRDIAEATGLSKKSISHLINQLTAQCLIRCVVPGGVPRGKRLKQPVAGKEGDVVRLSSVYYLNRAHRAYRDRQRPSIVVICESVHIPATRLVDLRDLTLGMSKLYRQSYQSELALLERVTYISSRVMSERREKLVEMRALRKYISKLDPERGGHSVAEKEAERVANYQKIDSLEKELRLPYVDLLPEIDDEWWRGLTKHGFIFCESVYLAVEEMTVELGLPKIHEFQLLPVRPRVATKTSSVISLGLVLLGYQEGFIGSSSCLFRLRGGKLKTEGTIDVSDRSDDRINDLMCYGVFGIPNSRLSGPGQK